PPAAAVPGGGARSGHPPHTRQPRRTPSRMNILHVIPFLRSEEGGPVRAVIDLSEAMSRRGHGVGVLTFDDRDAPAEWNHGDAPTTRVVRMGPGRTLGMASRGSAEASVEWADVVH